MFKNYRSLEEQEFRDLVLDCHKQGFFRKDPHTMNVKFSRSKRSLDFVSIVIEDDNKEVLGFCGLDIFETKFGIKGSIYCLGVPNNKRRKGYAYEALLKVEEIAKEKNTEIIEILSICNPISEKVHIKAGYLVTNPGRLSPTGKIMQIRLAKKIE